MREIAITLLYAFAAVGSAAADTKLADAQYPEGALWHRGRLYYAEMARNAVVVSDLSTTRLFWHTKDCGPVSVAPYRTDELVVLCHLAHKIVRVSLDGRTIAVVSHDSAGKPFVYPNGSSADDNGGVYFSSSGTFDLAAPATGAVLYLDREGRLARVAEGIHYANGVGVDFARKRLLVSAHLARKILAFPILSPGKLGPPEVFFDLDTLVPPEGGLYALAGPDGLEVDSDGSVVVAEYGAGQIHKIASDGTWLGTQGGFARFVTDMALLPNDRAAVTAARVNHAPPFPGLVVVREQFSRRFAK